MSREIHTKRLSSVLVLCWLCVFVAVVLSEQVWSYLSVTELGCQWAAWLCPCLLECERQICVLPLFCPPPVCGSLSFAPLPLLPLPLSCYQISQRCLLICSFSEVTQVLSFLPPYLSATVRHMSSLSVIGWLWKPLVFKGLRALMCLCMSYFVYAVGFWPSPFSHSLPFVSPFSLSPPIPRLKPTSWAGPKEGKKIYSLYLVQHVNMA